MNLKKIIILSIISIIILALTIPFMIFGIRSKVIQEDYQYLLDGGRIADVKIEDVPLVKQDISCGYAIIESVFLLTNCLVVLNYNKNVNHIFRTKILMVLSQNLFKFINALFNYKMFIHIKKYIKYYKNML